LLNSKEQKHTPQTHTPTVRVSERESGGGILASLCKNIGEPKIFTSPRSNVVIVDQKTSAKESIDNKQQSTDFEDDRHYLQGLMIGGR